MHDLEFLKPLSLLLETIAESTRDGNGLDMQLKANFGVDETEILFCTEVCFVVAVDKSKEMLVDSSNHTRWKHKWLAQSNGASKENGVIRQRTRELP